jgi:hypothetical protein
MDSIFSFDESKWSVFDVSYSIELKEQYPEIWAMSGGSKSDYVHSVLLEVFENGGVATTPEQAEVLELRESWINRHVYDSQPAGYIAQVKWLAVSSNGEAWQKRKINEEVSKFHTRNEWLLEKGLPCWKGYEQVGMKMGKKGKMVPNCVPIKTKSAQLKDPKGGLTAAGRKFFKRTEGADLKPGVKGAANTPEKMRRKGSFLTRFFTNPSGPMKDDRGRPTRLALSAAAWGEPVPRDASDAAALAAKGRRMLDRYERAKKKDSFENIETKVFTDSSNEGKFKSYIDSLDDKKFEELFPDDDQSSWNIPTEEKWIFDVAGAFLRRSITNRRRKRRR